MSKEIEQEEITPEKINEQVEVRKTRLKELRKAGEAYPKAAAPADRAGQLLADHETAEADALEASPINAEVAGRLMTIRGHGKTMFAHLQDSSGKIQLYIRKDVIGEEPYAEIKKLDIGDIVKVAGTLMRTRTGELTLRATAIALLTKSLRPLPEKWHGLKDVETRFRQRYVDLIVNEEARATFKKRSIIIKTIRNFLEQRGFMEVETPMMHSIPGGASAKPFITHHNALDMQLHLRIAPELHLKRLIVGGYEKVYEINRSFRNEGIDTTHNPEFTMIEFYQAYSDYEQLMTLTQELIALVATEVNGTTKTVWGGNEIELGGEYARYTFIGSLSEIGDVPEDVINSTEKAITWLAERGVKPEKSDNAAKVLEKLFDYSVEPKLVQPTFIYDYPLALSPLAKKKADDPTLTERFEFFVGTKEIANAYSELNDPDDQRSRFQAQADMRDGGDDEAQHMDEDFITALEYGMPPTGGEGIGIDRLVMLLTGNDSIREVILFPQLKKRN